MGYTDENGNDYKHEEGGGDSDGNEDDNDKDNDDN